MISSNGDIQLFIGINLNTFYYLKMGWTQSVPAEVNAMPKEDKVIDVEVVYCGAWFGKGEADYASNIIKTIYPNARINQNTPGTTRNLVVIY